jgi:hypothetical protein
LKPALRLIKSSLLKDFSSGSSINYYDGKFYLVGDDATNLLILDKEYKQLDSIRLFDYSEKRIPKAEKADFESATIIFLNKIPHLFIIGSASTEKRKKTLLLPVQNYRAGNNLFQPFFYKDAFLQQLKTKGITEINVEGSTVIKDSLILSNRGNNANRVNHLVIMPTAAMNDPAVQTKVPLSVIPLNLPVSGKSFIGVSELCYIEANDMLLITLSSEATDNAYDDGAISDSYIGCVNNISKKIHHSPVALDEMINLSEVDKAFVLQKIEGVCVEAVNNNQLDIHLVSDNDNGESTLFHVKAVLK